MQPMNKTKVYNRITGEEELIDADSIDQAVLSGSHGFDINSRVDVVDQDGNAFDVPASQVTEALEQGFSIEKPNQKAVREYAKENEGIKGAAKVFLGQAVDEALMGIPELVADKTLDPLELAKKEALKKQHEFANALGGITGFVGSMAYGAPIAKAGTKLAEKVVGKQLLDAGIKEGAGLGAKVIASAAEAAGQGIAFSAPKALTEAALGDPEEAAESLAVGMGTGLVFGAATPLFKKLYNATTKVGAKSLSNLKKAVLPGEEDAAMDLLAMTPMARVKFKKNYSDVVKDLPDFIKTNFTPTDVMDDAAFITKLKQKESDYGQQIGTILNTIDDAIEKSTDKTLKSNLMANLDERVKAANRQLSYYIKGFENSDSPADRSAAKQMREYLSNVETRTEKEGFATGIKNLQELKNRIQANTNYDATVPKAMQQFNRKAAKANADLMYSFANDFSKQFGDASKRDRYNAGFAQLGANLADANKQLRMIKSILPFVSQREGKTGARSIFSFNNAIPSAISATVGGTLAGPLGAIAGAAIPEVMRFGRPALGLYYTEKSMGKIADKLSVIPEAIKRMGVSSQVKPQSINAISSFLDDRSDEKKQTKLEQFQKLNEKLSELEADPQKLVDQMAKMATPLGDSIPNIKSQYMNLINRQVSYLNTVKPKAILPDNPFSPVKWQPNDTDLNKFERVVSVVQDPFSLIDDVSNGSVTKDQVVAVKTVYPKIYQRIQNRIMSYVTENPKDLSYSARLKLSMLFDSPLDQSLANIKSKQDTFAIIDAQDQAQAQGGPTKATINLAGNVSPTSDRILQRRG
jgi:hypothetical protein